MTDHEATSEAGQSGMEAVEFSTQLLGGYKKSDVDAFRHDVHQRIAELRDEIRGLQARLDAQAAAQRDQTVLDFVAGRLSELSQGDEAAGVAVAFRKLAPETRAQLLAIVRPKAAAALLVELPDEQRIQAISHLSEATLTTCGELEDAARDLAEPWLAERTRNRAVGGEDCLAALLEQAEDAWPAISAAWAEEQPYVVKRVRAKMLLSEDLLTFSSRRIQTMLRNLSSDDLCLFLASSPPEFREVIATGVSTRAFEMIKEELDILGAVTKERAAPGRRAVLEAARATRDKNP